MLVYVTRYVLQSEVWWQTQQTCTDVIVWSGHLAHVLPSLRGGIVTMDQLCVTVVILGVSTKHIKLTLQNSTSCSYMWHWQTCEGSPGVGLWIVHLTS